MKDHLILLVLIGLIVASAGVYVISRHRNPRVPPEEIRRQLDELDSRFKKNAWVPWGKRRDDPSR